MQRRNPFLIFILMSFIIITSFIVNCVPHEYEENSAQQQVMDVYASTVEYAPIEQNPDLYKIGSMFPNVSEWRVCGRGSGTLDRGSYEFDTLLMFYDNPRIVFKDEEDYTLHFNRNVLVENSPEWDNATDHYMTPKIAHIVDNLVDIMQQECPNLRVRITEAYDNNLEHGSTHISSLHYFGRAVDLNIYDTYESKVNNDYLPKLTELCVRAGFDWVLYEDTLHVHASCAPANANSPEIVFYGDSNSDSYEIGQYNMAIRSAGWAIKSLILKQGLYYLKFAEGNGYSYGYRGTGKLGRDDNIDLEKGYTGAPITIYVPQEMIVEFTFNPSTLRFGISGDSEVQILDVGLVKQLGYFNFMLPFLSLE